MEVNSATEVIEAVQSINRNYKGIRQSIEVMSDEELIELYERTKEVGNMAWYIRCIVLGVAHGRTGRKRGDGVVVGLAREFGIGKRMAEIDISVYNTFIKDNPDFEPLLPAVFYQVATRTEDPQGAIALALEKRAEYPSYPASAFTKQIKGKVDLEKAPPGVYLLIPLEVPISILEEEARTDGGGVSMLWGRPTLKSINGKLYMELK